MRNSSGKKIAIMELVYVRLLLAIEFGEKYKTLSSDIDQQRIKELRQGKDRTRGADLVGLEEPISKQKNRIGLIFSNKTEDLGQYDIYRNSLYSL